MFKNNFMHVQLSTNLIHINIPSCGVFIISKSVLTASRIVTTTLTSLWAIFLNTTCSFLCGCGLWTVGHEVEVLSQATVNCQQTVSLLLSINDRSPALTYQSKLVWGKYGHVYIITEKAPDSSTHIWILALYEHWTGCTLTDKHCKQNLPADPAIMAIGRIDQRIMSYSIIGLCRINDSNGCGRGLKFRLGKGFWV